MQNITASQTTKNKLLLTVEATAETLSLGRGTVYQMIQRGELPSVRIGRAVRIQREALDRFISERANA